jgi:hypothetical protein
MLKQVQYDINFQYVHFSQQSGEMEPKAGIAILVRQGQFASKCQFVRMKNAKTQ